jgi:hemerythrin superfamily protein
LYRPRPAPPQGIHQAIGSGQEGGMATQMNLYDSLRQDHQSIKHILDQMVKTSEADITLRTQLFNRLKVEFLAHARAEEKMLYPLLEQHRSSRDQALEGEVEHHAAESMLRELERTDVKDDHWKAKASVLREMILHHVQEEENKLFPKARKIFSEDEAEQLCHRFEDQKRVEQHHI